MRTVLAFGDLGFKSVESGELGKLPRETETLTEIFNDFYTSIKRRSVYVENFEEQQCNAGL